MNVASTIERLNPFLPEFIENPYPLYKRYQEADPVHWGISSSSELDGAWYLFRYHDVVKVLEDNRFVRQAKHVRQDGKGALVPENYSKLRSLVSKWLVFQDPPDHTRLRCLVNKAFSPKIVENMRPTIFRLANELLDKVENHQEMDLIEEFALPLPVLVIASLLGVEPKDISQFQNWSTALLNAQSSRLTHTSQAYQQAEAAARSLIDYFTQAIQIRLIAPREDLITALVKAHQELDKLSEEEIVSLCIHLLLSGYETTVNLIGKGMLALLRHPEALQTLYTNPSLITRGVEELLRYDSPVHLVIRWASVDVEIGNRLIRRGDSVGLMLAAANRDPQRFKNPDVLDLQREDCEHCVFGRGIHFCLGSMLARAEGQIAFNVLLNRLSNIQLPEQKFHWTNSLVFHGLKHLHITFRPSTTD